MTLHARSIGGVSGNGGGNSIVAGVPEDPQDSWTVVESKSKSKKKKKSGVLQVNKAVFCKKDPVFEATSKLKEKKGSLCCFDQVPQGTKMPLFQVPSSSVVDVFPTTLRRVTHSTRIRTCSSNVVWKKTLSLPIRSSLWSACYECGQREGAVACSVSAPEFMVSAARSPKFRDGRKDALATNKRDLDDGMDGVRSALGVRRGSGGAWTARETAGESDINGLL